MNQTKSTFFFLLKHETHNLIKPQRHKVYRFSIAGRFQSCPYDYRNDWLGKGSISVIREPFVRSSSLFARWTAILPKFKQIQNKPLKSIFGVVKYSKNSPTNNQLIYNTLQNFLFFFGKIHPKKFVIKQKNATFAVQFRNELNGSRSGAVGSSLGS